jgi:hypothetical protein
MKVDIDCSMTEACEFIDSFNSAHITINISQRSPSRAVELTKSHRFAKILLVLQDGEMNTPLLRRRVNRRFHLNISYGVIQRYMLELLSMGRITRRHIKKFGRTNFWTLEGEVY